MKVWNFSTFPAQSNPVPQTVLVWTHPQETLGPRQGRPAVMVSFFSPRNCLLQLLFPNCIKSATYFTAVASFVSIQYRLPVTCTCRNLWCQLPHFFPSVSLVSLFTPLKNQKQKNKKKQVRTWRVKKAKSGEFIIQTSKHSNYSVEY